MEKTLRSMAGKGWSHEEIKHAMKASHSGEKLSRHVIYRERVNGIIYWSGLVLLTVCNFVVSVVLIPFIIVISEWPVYFIVALLGLVFGSLFELIINNIELLEKKHHVFASLFIPMIAVLNMFIMTNVANRIGTFIMFDTHHSAVLISAVYATLFLLPYAAANLRKNL